MLELIPEWITNLNLTDWAILGGLVGGTLYWNLRDAESKLSERLPWLREKTSPPQDLDHDIAGETRPLWLIEHDRKAAESKARQAQRAADQQRWQEKTDAANARHQARK